MSKSLAVLIIEDVKSDAQLIIRLLKQAGYAPAYLQIETAEQMQNALQSQTWDIIISDYNLKQFDGSAALKILQTTGLDIPFMIVSGSIGEETAVAMMKAGAHDYLTKGNLARLIPAVQREVAQAAIRHEQRQSEKALAASEEKLRALVEQAPTTIYTESAETRRTLYISPQIEKLTGWTPAEWIEDPQLWKKMIHPADRKRVEEEDQNTTINRQEFKIEYRIITRDQRTRWIHDEAVIIQNQNNDPLFWQGVMYDITERKQAEDAQRESQSLYHSLVESSLLSICRKDLAGRFTFANRRFLELSNTTLADLIGKTDYDLHPSALAEKYRRDDQSILESGQVQELIEERTMHDGETMVVQSIKTPIYDGSGKINGIQISFWNITEHKRAEEHLKNSEERNRAILQTAMDGFWLADTQGNLLEVNETYSRMSGYSVQELLTMQIPDLESMKTPEEVKNRNQKIMKQGEDRFETQHRRKDGSIFNVEVSVQYRTAEGGRIVAFLKDITERKQTEKSLREQEKQYRTLVEQLPAIVFIDDAQAEGRTLYISPQIKTILGFTQEEWLERSPGIWDAQIHPDDHDWVHAGYKRCLLYGEPHNAEYRIKSANGKMLWLRDQAIRLTNENGNPYLIHGVMYDITERKKAEEALRNSEAKYHQLFNSMIDGLALHEIICDASGNPVDYRFIEINPAFERLTALRAQDLAGKTALEVLPKTEPHWIEIFGSVALNERSAFFEGNYGISGRYFEISAYCPRKGQFAIILVDITERKQAEESIHQRVTELEMLYQSGLALGQLLTPHEVGQKILNLLEEKLNWHNTRIRLYHPQDDSLELLDFNQNGLNGEMERRRVIEKYQSLITHSNQGMSGWVIQHGQPVRSGDVSHDARYIEAYSKINSGLYVPMKLGERTIGVISIEDERPDAFSESDERLIVTLATQAASAFENAHLFEETRQRVMELETLNRISLVLRAVSKQNEMLSIVLDEALAILQTSHGSIELYNKSKNSLEQIILRGWTSKLTDPHPVDEGITGMVFTSGETYITREFISDPHARTRMRSLIPPGWGGICLPIRTTQQTLGVMIVSMPSEHELNKNEIRLLSILSEMTGAALQRMQLHEQTIRRLEQLNALRSIDQAISSTRDMSLTLNVLLTHTLSQLKLDAADVLLLSPGSNLLNITAKQGFHNALPKNTSMADSVAGRAIMERQPIIKLDLEAVQQYPSFYLLWKQEGFVCYWCVPLVVKGESKGVLEVYSRKPLTPDSDWLEFLETLAGQAAIAIDNTQLFENLQRANLDLNMAYDSTIEGWSRAMDLRDHETEGHTLRVTELTMEVARAMQISESQLIAIRRGALLHDIGKMGVPDAILLKEGDLTDEEWQIMRKHPEFARDMLMPITYLNNALNIPYCHHEKWDGTGYPQGLKGTQIPLVARIFTVVDVWDALTNDRTYRKKWTKEKTCQYIREQSGKHFDPQVVEIFLNHIQK